MGCSVSGDTLQYILEENAARAAAWRVTLNCDTSRFNVTRQVHGSTRQALLEPSCADLRNLFLIHYLLILRNLCKLKLKEITYIFKYR